MGCYKYSYPDVEPITTDTWTYVNEYLEKNANKIAVKCEKTSIQFTYKELQERSLKWADELRRRFPHKKPTVVFLSSNIADFPTIILGTLAAGGILCPLAKGYPVELIGYIVRKVNPSVFVVEDWLLPKLQEVQKELKINLVTYCIGKHVEETINFGYVMESRSLDRSKIQIKSKEPCFIFFSSGTTGDPKGIIHSHSSVTNSTNTLKQLYYYGGPRKGSEQKHHITSLIMGHAASVIVFNLVPLVLGDCIVINEYTDLTGIINSMMKYKVDLIHFRTFTLGKLAALPKAVKIFSRVNYVMTIGSVACMESQKALLSRAPHIKFISGYGLSECLFIGITPKSENSLETGHLLMHGVKIQIQSPNGRVLKAYETGEIICRSNVKMNEYLNNKKATEDMIDKDGWVHTGDLGFLDDEGLLHVMGRAADSMVISGKTIVPLEIENILKQHPSVEDAAVIGVVDMETGQKAKAYIISTGDTTEKELKQYVMEQVDVPEKHLDGGVVFVKFFHRNPLGKVMKKELHKAEWNELHEEQ